MDGVVHLEKKNRIILFLILFLVFLVLVVCVLDRRSFGFLGFFKDQDKGGHLACMFWIHSISNQTFLRPVCVGCVRKCSFLGIFLFLNI